MNKNKVPDKSEKKVTNKVDHPDKISADVLEALDYQYKDKRNIEITISQPEFTSLCPISGLPDFGCITIKYIPDRKIIELKSLKLYLLQYRKIGVFYEHVVNLILDDLANILSPTQMEITGDFTPRGGIATRVTAVLEEKNDKTY